MDSTRGVEDAAIRSLLNVMVPGPEEPWHYYALQC